METVKGVLAIGASLVVLTGVGMVLASPQTVGIINAAGGTFATLLRTASGR